MPVANSTFSRPRANSPSASDRTLPCSAVTSEAISLRFASTSSRRWNITSARRPSPVDRHAGNAALAAATAASTSATPARSTLAVCSPVAGLNTAPDRPEPPSTIAPSIQWLMRFMGPPSGASECLARGRPARRTPLHETLGCSSDEVLGQAARDVAAVALGAGEGVVLDDHPAAAQHRVDLAVDLEALPRRVVHVHVVLLAVADRGVPVRVPH